MNFNFLMEYQDLSTLLNYCNECESFAHSAPDISITAARKALEYVVKLVYGTHISSNLQGLTLYDMLSDYDFKDYIGNQALLDAIHLIRKKGNQAVHEGNMSTQDSLSVLEALHYFSGEMCIKLGIIDTYPAFNPKIKPSAYNGSCTPTADEPEVDEMLLRRISQLVRGRMKSAAHANVKKEIIDVHATSKEGIDVGANGKASYQYLAGLICKWLPDVKILMEPVKSELILIHNQKETVIAIKTGCSTLGTKDYNGEWQILPHIDYVLYASDVVADTAIENQFRLLTRNEFVQFWEDLGLVRFKVSTAMRRKIEAQFGPDEAITVDKYADVISIQSFTNSGRKAPLVRQGLTKYPIVCESVLQAIV